MIQTWKTISQQMYYIEQLWDLVQPKEDKIYSYICGRLPTTSSRGNKYIYVMYVYECNAILTIATKNRSDKETIRDFTMIK